MNIPIQKYLIPILGTSCVVGIFIIVLSKQPPVQIKLDTKSAIKTSTIKTINNISFNKSVPSSQDILEKALFMPERTASTVSEKVFFSDLLIKGVWIGSERSVILSLKSKPQINLRVWQGDERASIAQVADGNDPRRPLVDFLNEWKIDTVDFSSVTFKNIITGEKETYAVQYKPHGHVRDSAQAGYGQGGLPGSGATGRRTISSQPRSGRSKITIYTPTSTKKMTKKEWDNLPTEIKIMQQHQKLIEFHERAMQRRLERLKKQKNKKLSR